MPQNERTNQRELWRDRRASIPLAKAALEGVAYGYKSKGILIHTVTDGNGMPLANCPTAANSSEREQVMPLIDRASYSKIINLVDLVYESKCWRRIKLTTSRLYVNVVSDHNCQNEPGRQRKIGADKF